MACRPLLPPPTPGPPSVWPGNFLAAGRTISLEAGKAGNPPHQEWPWSDATHCNTWCWLAEFPAVCARWWYGWGLICGNISKGALKCHEQNIFSQPLRPNCWRHLSWAETKPTPRIVVLCARNIANFFHKVHFHNYIRSCIEIIWLWFPNECHWF